MRTRIFKIVSSVAILTISPFVIIIMIGLLYVSYCMLAGIPIIQGFQSYKNFIYSLVPYFPYLTTIPIAILGILLLKKHTILSAAQKNDQQ